LTVVTTPALSSDWADANVGRPAHSRAAAIAKTLVPDMIALAPFDRAARGCAAPVSAWESKASATRTLRANSLKSRARRCQPADAKSLTLARNGRRYDETTLHFVLTIRLRGHATAARATAAS
jgi:hypothetical protein